MPEELAIVIGIVAVIIYGIVWVLAKVSEGASSVSNSFKQNQAFREKRSKTYPHRVIDTSKTLFQRNGDIIASFANKIVARPSENHGYRHRRYGNYYIENLT